MRGGCALVIEPEMHRIRQHCLACDIEASLGQLHDQRPGMFVGIGNDIERRREPPTAIRCVEDGRVIAWMVVVIAHHRVEYHAVEQFDPVLERRADPFQFLCQARITP